MNSKMHISKKRRQGGYTIVELGIALTIVAVLIISGLVGVNAVLASTKANDQISASGQTIARLQNIVSTSADLTGLDTQRAIGLSVFPRNRVNAARTAVNGVFSGGSEFIATNAAAIAGLGADTFGKAFTTGLFDIEMEDRIQDASERSNPIEAFIHLGVGSIDRMILRIEKRAKQLNNILMLVCGTLLATMMLAFFSTTMSLQSGIRNTPTGVMK